MLTYTFSRREKALILVFALILVAVAWFWFVFQNTTNRMTAIDGEIATIKSEVEIEQVRLTQLNSMTQTVEQRKAEGAKKTVMPTYDNLQPLMTQLNSIMATADTFTLTFDELNRENADYIRRGVRVDYSCDTFKKAESVVNSLAGGMFPCSVDSVVINDPTAVAGNTANRGVGWTTAGNNSMVTASVHVTFFEKYPEGYVAPTTDANAAKS